MLDQGMTALIDDLKVRGLLDDTLVVCMGEMGRTPRLGTRGAPMNRQDHFGDGWSVVLAGGGIKTAQVVGATNPDGFGVRDRRVGIADLAATLFQALGIDPYMEFSKPDGRPLGQLPDARQMALPRVQKPPSSTGERPRRRGAFLTGRPNCALRMGIGHRQFRPGSCCPGGTGKGNAPHSPRRGRSRSRKRKCPEFPDLDCRCNLCLIISRRRNSLDDRLA